MRNKRFNFPSILNIRKDLNDEFNLADVGNEFVSLHDSRYQYFGTFETLDFKLYIISPLFSLSMFTVFTFWIYAWKICVLLKISLIVLFCYFFHVMLSSHAVCLQLFPLLTTLIILTTLLTIPCRRPWSLAMDPGENVLVLVPASCNYSYSANKQVVVCYMQYYSVSLLSMV